MQVFQTAGVPPSIGSTIFAIIGCTMKRSDELRKSVAANRTTMRWARGKERARPRAA
jgi:hypothetical protein